MSDEKKSDNDEWQIDSLEEEDEIIELTEEVEPPLPKATKRDELDEIVFDLEDDSMPSAEEEVHELMDAALDEVGFDELAPLGDLEDDIIELGEETVPASDEEIHDLIDGAADDVNFEELVSLENDESSVIELVTETPDIPEDELAELTAEPIEEVAYNDVELTDETSGEDTLPELTDEIADDVGAVGLDALLPDAGAEEIGMPDIETEVEIEEVADLEPIVPETVPEMEPKIKSEQEMALHDRLMADIVDPVPSPADEIIEISEFDQQYYDEDSHYEAANGLPSVDEAEDDDYLELIDVDEADDDGSDFDDEIIHLDQLETESASTELDDILSDPDHTEAELASSASLIDDEAPNLTSKLLFDSEEQDSEPDIVQETEESIETEPDSAPAFFESATEAEDPDAEEEEGGDLSEAAEELDALDEGDTGSAVIPAAISSAQIEAAVANIIERDYAEKIETMVAGAIEKVVTLEIERIKAKLFNEDQE